MVAVAVILSTVNDEERYDLFEEFDDLLMILKLAILVELFKVASATAFFKAKLTLVFSSFTLKALLTLPLLTFLREIGGLAEFIVGYF